MKLFFFNEVIPEWEPMKSEARWLFMYCITCTVNLSNLRPRYDSSLSKWGTEYGSCVLPTEVLQLFTRMSKLPAPFTENWYIRVPKEIFRFGLGGHLIHHRLGGTVWNEISRGRGWLILVICIKQNCAPCISGGTAHGRAARLHMVMRSWEGFQVQWEGRHPSVVWSCILWQPFMMLFPLDCCYQLRILFILTDLYIISYCNFYQAKETTCRSIFLGYQGAPSIVFTRCL